MREMTIWIYPKDEYRMGKTGRFTEIPRKGETIIVDDKIALVETVVWTEHPKDAYYVPRIEVVYMPAIEDVHET
jgi:hypothetical protein